MNRCLVLIISVGVIATSAFSQPNPDTLWTRTYGGIYYDVANSVQQTTDGGFIVAGKTASFGAGGGDYYLVKTNGSGEPLWTRTYGGAFGEYLESVRQTADGGYIMAGTSNSFGPTFFTDIYLVKTNSLGDTLWTRTYGGELHEEAYSIAEADGGYVMAGLTTTYGAGGFDFYLVKTNSEGDTVWTRTYGGNSTEVARSVQQTLDGGYIIAGYTNSYGAGMGDFYLVKTNSQGDQTWARSYGGVYVDWAYSVQQTDDEGYVVVGLTQSFGASTPNVYILKTNSLGDSLWAHTYGEISSSDEAYCVQQTADGGFVMAGFTWYSNGGSKDFYLVKTNALGELLWTRHYGGTDLEGAYSVQQTTDGGYIIAGYTESFGAGLGDYYLVKTGPDPLSADDHPVYLPSSHRLSIYPNPFNPSTEIYFDLWNDERACLRVYNLLGREVAVLEDGFFQPGTYRATFDGSNLATGIYFARLDAGDFSQTKKLMLLK